MSGNDPVRETRGAGRGLRVVPLGPAVEDDWDALVRASPDGWVFALAGWQRLILAVPEWGLEDHSFGLFSDGRLVAVMPLQFRPASGVLSSSGFGGCGPILSAGLGERQRRRVLARLLDLSADVARRVGAGSLEFSLCAVTGTALGAARGVNPFVAHGFEDVSTHSMVVDLAADEDVLWSHLSQSARQAIRRARQQGLTAGRCDWRACLDEYYGLHVETYHRTSVSPHPRAYFEGIAHEMAPPGHAVLFGARDNDGEPMAFHNDARLGVGALYHTGCSSSAALDAGANYLLFWEAMLDAKRSGCRWYECGEVFPGLTEGKAHGLTVFKSKFGGSVHRFFRARLEFPAESAVADDGRTGAEPSRREVVHQWLRSNRMLLRVFAGRRVEGWALRVVNLLRGRRHESDVPAAGASVCAAVGERDVADDERSRNAFTRGDVYAPERICRAVDRGSTEHTDQLLGERLDLVRKYLGKGVLVDLCCGTGAHLKTFAGETELGLGLDFSERYLREARVQAQQDGHPTLRYLLADARRLPLARRSVQLLFCLSALYVIPRVEDVVTEIARVLEPDGLAILEFGNSRSLNAVCCRAYDTLAPTYFIPVTRMLAVCRAAGLEIVEHRSFQILPLWADKPRWLWPLLHPGWKRLMSRRIGARMLDEHVSSLAVVRGFAFRHVLVVRRPSGATGLPGPRPPGGDRGA